MRIPRIFTDQTLFSGTEITLEEQASNHISRVLRMQEGRDLILFNGQGGYFQAQIASITKKSLTVSITEFFDENKQSALPTELGIAISKGDRMEWLIQKATELGIHSITPLLTENSQLKLNAERMAKKQKQWQQIAISACEQCGRNIIPVITEIQTLSIWLPTVNAEKKLVLHHRSDTRLTGDKPASVALLIGPEGGLSTTEISSAQTLGFQALTLGPRVLRTETAPLTALSIIQFQWGDF
ncbi:MAG: 16S rRNA (uracil(1498)-N(3))-methyltransferase [Pseudomonadales bacterium]|nr:16S rRNA (uracil(1498)-N(3))-methyltransferase [Pseudomonadales bacterium]